MTEEPQQPTQAEQILGRILEELNNQKTENQNLRLELEALKKQNNELSKNLDEFANGVAQGFEKRDTLINQISERLLAAPTQTQGNGLAGTISKIVDTITNQMATGQVAGGLSEMDLEILKQSKAIQSLALKNAFAALRKNSGLAAEIVDHVTVEP